MAAARTIPQASSANSSWSEPARPLALRLALSAAVALVSQPLAAQQQSDAQQLEELIPESAVRDPEGWAADGVPGEVRAELDALPSLDPATPLADLPGITVPWPDGTPALQLAPLEPAAEPVEFVRFDEAVPAAPPGREEIVSPELVLVLPADPALFPQRAEFLARFRGLSAVVAFTDDDNLARLTAQARADEELLARMLRVYGYFDAQIARSVQELDPATGAASERPTVRFDVQPGTRYTVGAIDLGNLAATGEQYGSLLRAYDIKIGDPLSLDAIAREQLDLDRALGESGYPFAAIAPPGLLVDHDRDQGDITMAVEPGGRYTLRGVVSQQPDFLSSRHLTRIARWDQGDVYRRSDELDLRRAILATGLVSAIDLTPVVVQEPVGDAPGVIDLAASMTRAPLRTLAGSIGYGTGYGFRLEGSWEHRNLFPPEGLLRLRGVAGTQEQLVGLTFQRSNFLGRDRVFTLDAYASTIGIDAYDARTLSLVARYERQSTLLFQRRLSWGAGLELLFTQQTDIKVQGQTPAREDYAIAALPGFVQFDTTDNLLDPTEGWRLRLSGSPEFSRVFSANSQYLRLQFDLSTYQRLGADVVLAARGRAGTIQGAPIAAIAPSRRFYAGGGGSVRGYGFNEIGPTTAVGTPNGGRSLVEAALEARVHTDLLDGALSVVPFIDAGAVSRDTLPDLADVRFGAGLGLRYDTGFGPLRLDIATPLNPRPGDSPVAVYVALGQAF